MLARASQEQAIQLLNDAKISVDAKEKARKIPILMHARRLLYSVCLANFANSLHRLLQVNRLKGLHEIVVKKDPSLIPTFLPEVLELQVDPSPVVRRQVLDFFDGAVQTAPDAIALSLGLQCISHLLQDSVSATVKRAVVSAYPTYRAVLAIIVAQGSTAWTDEAVQQQMQTLWQAAGSVKTAIVSLATTPETSSGIKLSACKFVEQGIMLHTADSLPAVTGLLAAPRQFPTDNPIITKAVMLRDGEKLLATLVAILKRTAEQEDTGTVAITVIRSSINIIQHRPQFIGRVLPLLLNLAKTKKYKASPGVSCVVKFISADTV